MGMGEKTGGPHKAPRRIGGRAALLALLATLATTMLAVPAAVGAASQQAKLTATDGAAFDDFGLSVAVDGDTAVVGAFNDDVGANANQGSAYVFTRTGSTWTEQAKLTAADGAADDEFGARVAVSGDTALVGVPSDDVGGNQEQGSAYVFTGVSVPVAPTSKDQCQNNGWKNFPQFKNQGECVSFVERQSQT
jgi:hypothetical protein